MWSGTPAMAAPPPPPMYSGVPQQATTTTTTGQKHDIFVGNLAFNTSEEQLLQAFSEIGRVINVRLVMDLETGKPRGFAFVEFEDPQAALSAIRNMNDYELNGRRLRVNFSNSSHLEQLATELGMDLSQQTQRSQVTNTASAPTNSSSSGTSAVAESLKNMSKAEMYDVVAKLKEIADRDQDEARRLISGHPQLPEALLFLMSKLDMVKTPVADTTLPTTAAAAVMAVRVADPRARVVDPRAAAAAAAAAVRVDPRQQAQQQQAPASRVDPRADPRNRMANTPATTTGGSSNTTSSSTFGQLPPPPPPPPPGMPPPPPPASGGLSHLDPGLIQQVMSLTPQQIQQLPPDKQQSILQLRQQITGVTGQM